VTNDDRVAFEEVRPLVKLFAVEMELQFRENEAAKGHGSGEYPDVGNAFASLAENVGDVARVLKFGITDAVDQATLVARLADVANVAALLGMMKNGHWPRVNEKEFGKGSPVVLETLGVTIGVLKDALEQIPGGGEAVRFLHGIRDRIREAASAHLRGLSVAAQDAAAVEESASATVERAGHDEGGES